MATLRARKHRPAKPLAVMLPVADGLPDAARQLLTTPAAPIVLVDKKYVPELCDDIAPGLNEVGVMLHANPLQHLLLQELQCPLVMTSGNLSGKPPAISNEQALADLQGIADGFLIHNRDIVQRLDVSVVRDSGEMLRRSRGYVPDALALPPCFKNGPPVLCLGLQCPLVMTSGNLSGKPPAISNEQALADLQGIADGFLIHNRDIVQRMDDSVVRESGEMLRRSRGYVPDALVLPPGFKNVPPVLCLGADLKNTFCLVRGEQAVLSQHLGDLSDDGIQMQWREALRLSYA